MILDTLANAAKERVAVLEKKKGFAAVREEAELIYKNENFAKKFMKSLQQPGLNFICECKKASPSKGMIVKEFPYLDIESL